MASHLASLWKWDSVELGNVPFTHEMSHLPVPIQVSNNKQYISQFLCLKLTKQI